MRGQPAVAKNDELEIIAPAFSGIYIDLKESVLRTESEECEGKPFVARCSARNALSRSTHRSSAKRC
jgi:hypothetical protein